MFSKVKSKGILIESEPSNNNSSKKIKLNNISEIDEL